MNRAWEHEHLDQAYRHIAELKAHIVRQRVLLKDALDTGQPSELAESMLHALEGKPPHIREASPTDPRTATPTIRVSGRRE